jgi:trk system potassium uptake protein TrkA
MYVLVCGGGKVGTAVTRALLRMGHEVTLVEQRRERFDLLAEEFEHQVLAGDATEIHVLERAGIARPPDLVVAVTGDDEGNIVICQIAKEGYGVPKTIARVNDPRNQEHFDLLGIGPTISAVRAILGLVEHEVPEHELVHLLQLSREGLEIVEVSVDEGTPAAGRRVDELRMPDGCRLISVMREGKAEIAIGATELRPGDQVLAILEPGREGELRRMLLKQEQT